MGKEFAWADLHIDQEHCRHRRNWFPTLKEYQDDTAKKWDETVGENDTIWLCGDICTTWEGLRWIKARPGKKILVLGNWDKVFDNDIRTILEVYDDVEGFHKHQKGFYISHAPTHPSDLRNRKNIHGHRHDDPVPDSRYVCVSIDMARSGPVSFADIISGRYSTFDRQGKNND